MLQNIRVSPFVLANSIFLLNMTVSNRSESHVTTCDLLIEISFLINSTGTESFFVYSECEDDLREQWRKPKRNPWYWSSEVWVESSVIHVFNSLTLENSNEKKRITHK